MLRPWVCTRQSQPSSRQSQSRSSFAWSDLCTWNGEIIDKETDHMWAVLIIIIISNLTAVIVTIYITISTLWDRPDASGVDAVAVRRHLRHIHRRHREVAVVLLQLEGDAHIMFWHFNNFTWDPFVNFNQWSSCMEKKITQRKEYPKKLTAAASV